MARQADRQTETEQRDRSEILVEQVESRDVSEGAVDDEFPFHRAAVKHFHQIDKVPLMGERADKLRVVRVAARTQHSTAQHSTAQHSTA